jgi:hypothetical protein
MGFFFFRPFFVCTYMVLLLVIIFVVIFVFLFYRSLKKGADSDVSAGRTYRFISGKLEDKLISKVFEKRGYSEAPINVKPTIMYYDNWERFLRSYSGYISNGASFKRLNDITYLYGLVPDRMCEQMKIDEPRADIFDGNNMWVATSASTFRGTDVVADLDDLKEIQERGGAEIVLYKYVIDPMLVEKKRFRLRYHMCVYRGDDGHVYNIPKDGASYVVVSEMEYVPGDYKNILMHNSHEIMYIEDVFDAKEKKKILGCAESICKEVLDKSDDVGEVRSKFADVNFCVMGADFLVTEDLDVYLLNFVLKPNLWVGGKHDAQMLKSIIDMCDSLCDLDLPNQQKYIVPKENIIPLKLPSDCKRIDESDLIEYNKILSKKSAERKFHFTQVCKYDLMGCAVLLIGESDVMAVSGQLNIPIILYTSRYEYIDKIFGKKGVHAIGDKDILTKMGFKFLEKKMMSGKPVDIYSRQLTI